MKTQLMVFNNILNYGYIIMWKLLKIYWLRIMINYVKRFLKTAETKLLLNMAFDIQWIDNFD